MGVRHVWSNIQRGQRKITYLRKISSVKNKRRPVQIKMGSMSDKKKM